MSQKIIRAKQIIEKLLKGTGIEINGSNPWDLQVHNDELYSRVLSCGSLGFGEAYMDGWWDCRQIDEMMARLLKDDIRKKIKANWPVVFDALLVRLTNRQNKKRAFEVGQVHYDVGNDLYKAMLDKRMVYTCGYWKQAQNLDEAQEAKLDLVCRKIGLKPGDRVLDIGSGWGSFAKFAAENYGAQVVGVTVSKEQKVLADELCKGLSVETRLQDYREVNEPFDHIVSLGMVEHVGYKNYRTFMEVANRCLKDSGFFLLHTIGSLYSAKSTDPWIGKYIFPNSMLPSLKQLTGAVENLFVVEDIHNFGPDYDKTLLAWHENFEKHWPELKEKYGERFYRMWKYYLLSCAGSFRSRKNQLWQIVFSKHGAPKGYVSVR